MPIEGIIARYGLLAIFAGAGIEGEAVVITGGVLAHHGLLPLWGVALAAAVGSCMIDQLWFLAGRRFRDHRRVRSIAARPAFARALRILERHPRAFIFGFRFVYGLRTVSPIAIGTSAIPARTFLPFNILAAVIWGPTLAWLGFAFGKAIDPLFRDMHAALLAGIFGVLVLGTIVLGVRVARAALAR